MTSAVILWWVLSGLSVIFVLADWHHAPIDLTMHVGFVLIVAFMGPLGALMYVLTVREPLPGTHEAYVAPRWKQVVGSTFHCVSGDSVGIVGIAVLTPWVLSHVDPILEIVLEYMAGFLVGWLIFQALFMKDMAGGSYLKAVRSMFMPEWISMNGVMTGMALVMVFWLRADAQAADPLRGEFWLMMSASLVAGLHAVSWRSSALARQSEAQVVPRWKIDPTLSTDTVALTPEQPAVHQVVTHAGHPMGQVLRWSQNGWTIMAAYQSTLTGQAMTLAAEIARSVADHPWTPTAGTHPQIVVSMLGGQAYRASMPRTRAIQLSAMFYCTWIDGGQSVRIGAAGSQLPWADLWALTRSIILYTPTPK